MGTKKRKTSSRSVVTPTRSGRGAKTDGRQCGLCGKTGKLDRTECCNRWICDDEENYALFSYARNSCSRNHRRYTLCGFHSVEQHSGEWQTCESCRTDFETEIYVHYGTNEYNFERLQNPPEFTPTRCQECNEIIRLGEDGYAMKAGAYICSNCYRLPF